MKQLIAFTLILALLMPAGSLQARDNRSRTDISTSAARMVTFKGQISNNKVVLQWEVGENETIYQFEVEKSTDGKNFALAALVFSTEKTATDNYMFFEKASAEKAIYRIKIIDKDGKAEYSNVLTLTASAQ